MPTPPDAPPGGTPRRAFLRLAALTPLAAACATLPATPPAAALPPAAPPAPDDALTALRAFPLPDDAEPAALFRAAATGGRGG